MTDPHEPLKFKINNPLSRIRHQKPNARGAWCSQNSLEIGPESLYLIKFREQFRERLKTKTILIMIIRIIQWWFSLRIRSIRTIQNKIFDEIYVYVNYIVLVMPVLKKSNFKQFQFSNLNTGFRSYFCYRAWATPELNYTTGPKEYFWGHWSWKA